MSAARHPRDSLSAWIDGDLPARDGEAVRAHVEACATCRAEADVLRAMVAEARRLDRPEPPPTLWSAIEGELARTDRTLLRWRPFLAGSLAGAAAVVLLALAVGPRARLGGPPRDAPVASAAAPVSAAPSTTPGLLARGRDPLLAEAEAAFQSAAETYERSIAKLRDLLERQQAGWSPEARARLGDSLARLDEAVAASRAAARRAPGEAGDHDLLFAAYRREIDFLASAVQRGAPGPGGVR